MVFRPSGIKEVKTAISSSSPIALIFCEECLREGRVIVHALSRPEEEMPSSLMAQTIRAVAEIHQFHYGHPDSSIIVLAAREVLQPFLPFDFILQ